MKMKRRLSIAILVFLMCLLAALPAMAADVFRFAEEAVQVYAGYSITPELIRDGRFAVLHGSQVIQVWQRWMKTVR